MPCKEQLLRALKVGWWQRKTPFDLDEISSQLDDMMSPLPGPGNCRSRFLQQLEPAVILQGVVDTNHGLTQCGLYDIFVQQSFANTHPERERTTTNAKSTKDYKRLLKRLRVLDRGLIQVMLFNRSEEEPRSMPKNRWAAAKTCFLLDLVYS